MSPEEFELGAPIDVVTNVFNIGAMAFGLLGGEKERSYARWDAGEALYQVQSAPIGPSGTQRLRNSVRPGNKLPCKVNEWSGVIFANMQNPFVCVCGIPYNGNY